MRYSIRKAATVATSCSLVPCIFGANKADRVTETAPAVATATATPETAQHL